MPVLKQPSAYGPTNPTSSMDDITHIVFFTRIRARGPHLLSKRAKGGTELMQLSPQRGTLTIFWRQLRSVVCNAELGVDLLTRTLFLHKLPVQHHAYRAIFIIEADRAICREY